MAHQAATGLLNMSLGCLWVYLHIPRLLSATHVLDRRELSASERGAVPWMKCRTAFAAANRRWRKRGVSDSEWRWRGGCGSGRRHQTFSLLLRLLLSLRSVVQPEPKSQHQLSLATTFPFSDKSQKPWRICGSPALEPLLLTRGSPSNWR